MDHLLETLLSLVKFGGQGFGRVARGSPFKTSNHPGLIERIDAGEPLLNYHGYCATDRACSQVSSTGSHFHGCFAADSSAVRVPVISHHSRRSDFMRSFLHSEPQASLRPFMDHANAQIQANAIDLIQAIVARGELDGLGLESLEAAVVGKLYCSVHLDRVDLQNKLLHVLHSIISASSAADPHRPRTSSKPGDTAALGEAAVLQDAGRSSYFVRINPLLVQTLIDGITMAAGRPTPQHWLDFVLMTVPQFPRVLSYMVSPLGDCVCRQLRHALADVKKVLDHDTTRLSSITSGTTDAEFIMLLNALERLVLLSLTKSHDSPAPEDDTVLERPVPESSSSGLLGIVSNVFGSESSGMTEDYLSVCAFKSNAISLIIFL